VIVTSFTVDVVFVGGISGDDGQKAAAALVVLLVWRIARVVDGNTPSVLMEVFHDVHFNN